MQDSLRYRSPGKCFVYDSRWVGIMTSEELLKRLEEYHKIVVDKKTPYNYAKYGWIPAPKVINKGRAGGKVIDYDECSTAEFVASYRLKREKKVSKEDVSIARKIALEGPWNDFIDLPDYMKFVDLSFEWKNLLNEALEIEVPEMKLFHDELKKIQRETAGRLDELLQERKALLDEYENVCSKIFSPELRTREKRQVGVSNGEPICVAEAIKRETEKLIKLSNENMDKIYKFNAEILKQATEKTFGSE